MESGLGLIPRQFHHSAIPSFRIGGQSLMHYRKVSSPRLYAPSCEARWCVLQPKKPRLEPPQKVSACLLPPLP